MRVTDCGSKDDGKKPDEAGKDLEEEMTKTKKEVVDQDSYNPLPCEQDTKRALLMA